MRIFLLLLFSIALFSCSNQSKTKKIFNPNNLRSQYFSIDPSIENTLMGIRGGYFNIPAGSFDGDEPVNIEIKEAYNPAEFLYAGLTTESNGRLLQSGGMIYFNATRKGKKVRLLKEVNISIPTDYEADNMQLFKGEQKKDGTIN